MEKNDISTEKNQKESNTANQLYQVMFNRMEEQGVIGTAKSISDSGEALLLGIFLVHLKKSPFYDEAMKITVSKFQEMRPQLPLKYNIK